MTAKFVRMALAATTLSSTVTSAQVARRLNDAPDSPRPMQLRQVRRTGSLSGDDDAFGRVAYVAILRDGGTLVADDKARRISWFDAHGRLVKHVGRSGEGPGEFVTPWLIEVTRHDSVLVWDAGLARISVFSPALQYVRSFSTPTMWTINSLRELPDGRLLVSAFDMTTKKVLHVMSRTGRLESSFAPISVPRGVEGYQGSLLGGVAQLLDTLVVLSYKSPYRLDLFNLHGELISSCFGPEGRTTAPERVVTRAAGNTVSLRWKEFVHTTALLPGSLTERTVFMNLIVDRVKDEFTLDVVDVARCRLLRRARLPAPIQLNTARGRVVAGFMELDFPEVVVFDLQMPSR